MMAPATPILTTKLFVPPPNPRHVRRPRLDAMLNVGLKARLMLVSAPAGFGKTTLLANWVENVRTLERANVRTLFAWISLDEGDNDIARFLAYTAAALEMVKPGIASKLSGVAEAPQLSQVESSLNSLINDLAGANDSIVLVLDDYHTIASQAIHQALNHLIEHMPPPLHLILATRADPPLHLARLRARGQLIEIRQDDLRFTPEEASLFLRQSRGLELTGDQFAALASRTEGWIAGLHLASLALQPAFSSQNQGNVSDFIRNFAGSSRFILDYLMEEVLSRQPEAIQDFLLQTSILERLNAPLCDALFENRELRVERGYDSRRSTLDSQYILEYLERANLFIVPLDPQRRWYRYHHLFADLLRQRLEATRPGDISGLHQRASRWFEANDLLPEAIAHALAAEDFERATELVEAAAEATLAQGEMTTLSSWIDSLPDHLVRTRPYLCIYHAFALFFRGGSREKVEARLKDAQQADADQTVLSVVRAFNSLLTGFRDDLTHPFKISHEPLENLPGKGQFLRSLAAAFTSVTHILSEDLPHTLKELEQAAHISQEAGNWMGYLALQSQIAGFYMIQGKLRAADAKYKQMLEFVGDDQSAPLPVTGLAYIGKGDLLREWNELDAAMRYLEKGAELIKTEEINILYAYINLAKARQAQGDVEGALEEIQRAVQTARQFDISSLDDRYVSIFQARLWIAQGNLAAATGWMQKRGLDQDFRAEALEERGSMPFLSVFLRGLELNTLARLHLASGQPAQALEILDPLVPSLEKQKFISLVIEALVLQALASQAQAQSDCALAALERALALAEPEGYMRIFLDEGEPMRLLIFNFRFKIEEEQGGQGHNLLVYLDRLLTAFGPPEVMPQSQIINQQSSIPNSLTARELEVLQSIAAGLSNQEIAERMILALSTVKTHVHNIYRKLGVTSRTLAAARARELHLL